MIVCIVIEIKSIFEINDSFGNMFCIAVMYMNKLQGYEKFLLYKLFFFPLLNKVSWPKQKGVYGFSDVMGVNDVIYDVTIGNVQHVAQMFQQNTVAFIF